MQTLQSYNMQFSNSSWQTLRHFSLDFIRTRLLMKLFNTSSTDIVNECRVMFNIQYISSLIVCRRQNLKTNYQILVIFGTNIPDTTCHQMAFQFPTSPNVCFCTT